MNLSIIIPNYNGESLLKKNLPKVIEAVASYKKGNIEIIIPDDASKDNSLETIQKFQQTASVQNLTLKGIKSELPTNRGFSGNVNIGVKAATGDILILLNSDVVPHKDFLEPLLRHFENPKIFAVGCMDESVEEGNVILRGRGIGSWKRGFLMHTAGKLDKSNTLWVSCGSGAFRRSIWNSLGGLNELYNPFYWEDIDLSYRAQKSGYTILFEKKSIVTHAHEEGAIQKNYSSYNKIKIVYRNQFTFVWINITDTTLLLSHMLWLPYHTLKALLRMDKAYFWGLWHAVLRLLKVLTYKNNARKLFVLADKEIIKQFAKE